MVEPLELDTYRREVELRYILVRVILSNSRLVEKKLAEYYEFSVGRTNFHNYYQWLRGYRDELHEHIELTGSIPNCVRQEVIQFKTDIEMKPFDHEHIEKRLSGLLEKERDCLLDEGLRINKRQRSCC